MRRHLLLTGILGVLAILGCAQADRVPNEAAPPPPGVVLLNVTSGAVEDPHAVTMALQLAAHALDDGRDVVIFFNVRGVQVPTTDLPDDLAFHDRPIKEMLTDLMSRGAQVHVCPACMKAMNVAAGSLLPGAMVTDREKLFARIGPDTVVFSY